ncbi:MAG: hypothetical protein ACXVYY_00925 [Oryzihumus sp.]
MTKKEEPTEKSRKTPTQRAQEAVDVCDRKILRAQDRRAHAALQVQLANKVLEDLRKERAYLVANPLLQHHAHAEDGELPGQTTVEEQVALSAEELAILEEEQALAASQ